MLLTKFHIIWPSGFKGKAALEINEQETRIAYDSHVCKWIKTECPLKPLCQMNRNMVGSIYGRSSIKSAHFVPIH
jgi:hypothetical protein